MARCTTTFTVAAPIAEVDAFVADPTNARFWDPSVASIEADPLDPAAWDLVVAFYGKRIPFRLVRGDATPGRVVSFRGTHAAAVLDQRFELTSEGAGTTVTFTSQVRLTGVLRVFNKGLDSAFVALTTRSATRLEAALGALAPAH